jgi:hypothetical protein
MKYASKDHIFNTIENLTDAEKIDLWRCASRFLVGTRFSGPADLFHETVNLLLQGSRHWPLRISFGAYMRAAMMSVAGTDRERHENQLAEWTPVEELLDRARQDCLREDSVLDLLLQKERVELAMLAMELARATLSSDVPALRVIDGWIAGMSPEEICHDFVMKVPVYDAARKRALRAIHKEIARMSD